MWTLLSYLAAVTEHIAMVPAVANLPLRPPAVLARAVASLDILSGGRVELGLGAGAFWPAIHAMGGPVRKPGEAIGALAEAVEVLRALWGDSASGSVDMDGEHYGLHGAKPGPSPVHKVGIWLGVYGPRAMRVTGQLADGWIGSTSYGPPEKLLELMGGIDAGAQLSGRSPGEIRRIYVIDPSMPAEQLAEFALAHGISGFMLPVSPDGERAAVRFAGDVVPEVRAVVEAARRS